jgi:hypothetical protein
MTEENHEAYPDSRHSYPIPNNLIPVYEQPNATPGQSSSFILPHVLINKKFQLFMIRPDRPREYRSDFLTSLEKDVSQVNINLSMSFYRRGQPYSSKQSLVSRVRFLLQCNFQSFSKISSVISRFRTPIPLSSTD